MNNLLNLEKAYNVRTLGGYKTSCGKKVNDRLFLRGDCLSRLSKNDIDYLINYGLGAVIDLRSSDELESRPNKFYNNDKVLYYNIPLITNEENGANTAQDLTKLLMQNASELFPKFYLNMLMNSKHCIKEIFEVINKNLDKTTLFHCTAGKDRTGITAMLLLGLAGVSDEDIIENYIVTYDNNRKNPDFENAIKSIPIDVFYSTKEYITPSISYIKDNYNTYYDYLLSTGLNDNTLENIKKAMLI